MFKRFRIKNGVQQFVQTIGTYPHQGGFFINHALTQHFHGDAHHGCTRSFAIAGLEHPEFTFLDGELHVLHVFIMVFQGSFGMHELLVHLRHDFFQ